ncbi:MAG: putative periplasmic protein kinase ArgK [Alphaproteobacteria bacterium]|jgi:LAO/AO transport system kinase|nr:putative periplasmic protein kinase ArgK [Alphaproteobacteria bacterium]
MQTPSSLAAVKDGGKPALAAALARIERAPDDEATIALLSEAYTAPRAHVLGITGPPGVGKSTLLSALIKAWRARGKSVGVIAVDPSSRRTGGALLGDRTRIVTDPDDSKVFIRSMAARDRLGGLAELTFPATVLMRALFDIVIVETVGVGQSETDVVAVADTVLFCVQPGAGDSLQFMKAGIAEIPHLIAVTKADLGTPAERARADVEGALSLAEGDGGWQLDVLLVSAAGGAGVETLIDKIEAHRIHLANESRGEIQRLRQAETWIEDWLRAQFGRQGLTRAGQIALKPRQSPFASAAEIAQRLRG